MPIELVCFGFGIVGGLIGMLLFCLIWDDGFRRGAQTTCLLSSHDRATQGE
jgi:hypothetical protein